MDTAITFTTHTGEVVKGERLTKALNQVANDWIQIAKNIRAQDHYASHVTEQQKEDNLLRDLEYAEQVRLGTIDCFTIWQRVNEALTGECIALLRGK